MARHRNFRNLHLNDDDFHADDFDCSVDEEFAVSPSQERYINRPSRATHNFGDFIDDGKQSTDQPHTTADHEYDDDRYDNETDDTFGMDDYVAAPSKAPVKAAAVTKIAKPPPKQPRPKPQQAPIMRVLNEEPHGRSQNDSPCVSRTPTPTRSGNSKHLSAMVASPILTRHKDRNLSESKPHINLVVVGHVDAGKSTLLGHLLFQIGTVNKRQMHKFETDSKKVGKASFAYAWVLDETEEERSRGITMDIATRQFATQNRQVTLLDAPGHKDFIPNMISGAALADCALLVVNGTRGEFESGYDLGGQTREHAFLLRALGIAHVIVAVNKLDTVDWSQERYDEICATMRTFLCQQVNFAPANVRFVPVSALSGENVANAAPPGHLLTQWYTGPTVLQLIDTLPPTTYDDSRPLRMTVSSVYKGATSASTLTLCGVVVQGSIDIGDRVLVQPYGVQAVVKSLVSDTIAAQMNGDGEEAFLSTHASTTNENSIVYAGEGCTLTLASSTLDGISFAPGCVICHVDNVPIAPTKSITAKIVVFSSANMPLVKGCSVELHSHNICEPAYIRKLISIMDKDGEPSAKRPRCLPCGKSGVILLGTENSVCVESTNICRQLGRVTLRAGGNTIAAGVILDATQRARTLSETDPN